MHKKYLVHPDFKLANLIHAPTDPVGVNALNYLNSRSIERLDLGDDIRVENYEVVTKHNTGLPIMVLSLKNVDEHLPCLICYHGGGFMLKASPILIKNMAEYVRRIHCVVVIPDYRLLPEHPFPNAFNDAYETLEWVSDNGANLGINPSIIALQGDSAGGALAAGVALKARDDKGPLISLQLLIYPVTDYQQKSESISKYWDAPVWDAKKNIRMWTQYLTVETQPLLGYASPLHAADHHNLPETYLEVAEYDCLRDEGLAYGKVLESSGNRVKTNEVKGGVHGYDNFMNSTYVDGFVDQRIELLKEVFGQQ